LIAVDDRDRAQPTLAAGYERDLHPTSVTQQQLDARRERARDLAAAKVQATVRRD